LIQSKTSNSIKSENRKILIGYFLFQIVLFAIFAGHIDFNLIDADQFLAQIKKPQGFISLCAALFIIVMEGIFPNGAKEILVFWRFKNRLPGHRAFTHIGPNDPRINMEKLKKLYPDGLPTDPKKQNSEWYLLYKQYRNALIVHQAHKAFLLTRDFTALTAAFIPLTVFGHLLLESHLERILYHLLFLAAFNLWSYHCQPRTMATVSWQMSWLKLSAAGFIEVP